MKYEFLDYAVVAIGSIVYVAVALNYVAALLVR